MSSALILGGVDELLAELARLAPDLTGEAAQLQQTIAIDTATAIRAAYPAVTGALRASVQVERLTSASPARVYTEVTVAAPYAHFVEFGTADRAPNPAFVPLTRQGRERFAQAVVDRVKDHGLVVSGVLRNG
jgi:Bacteriophage HK97-gp10, putative tail-component